MKTFREYAQLLPEGIREMFLLNMENVAFGKNPDDRIYYSFLDAAFNWFDSPEGGEFWNAVHEDFIHHYGNTYEEWDAALGRLSWPVCRIETKGISCCISVEEFEFLITREQAKFLAEIFTKAQYNVIWI